MTVSLAVCIGAAVAIFGTLSGANGTFDQSKGFGSTPETGLADLPGTRAAPASVEPFSAQSNLAPPSLEFERFRAAVQYLNEKAQAEGSAFFIDVLHFGNGVVQVTVTDAWLSAPKEVRTSSLDKLYQLWRAADGSGFPVTVRVVDKNGKVVSEKTDL